MTGEIVNRVAGSPLVTIDLEEFYQEGERVVFDIKNHLFQGLILKEKDFRDFIKQNDWSAYKDKLVSIVCSADAIVPTWAYMLVAQKMQEQARFFIFGDLQTLETAAFLEKLKSIHPPSFEGKPVVIKGCFGKPVPVSAYVEITRLLAPYAKSIMYGEACSTVPVFKRKGL
jgi:hypothetical protein